ncbi:ATPase PAAT isoform X2 [Ascaphus truei]|uniref:ATPase PAAT isoform X2 n=1 Tax=Ascaphus truei TaxID=8439 RepID=UPI003F5AAB02
MSGPMSSVLSGCLQTPVVCTSTWLCNTELCSVLEVSCWESATCNEEIPTRESCVLLEPALSSEPCSPCTLSICCIAEGKDGILCLTIFSEARTMEVYSGPQGGQEEEYQGTSRGEKLCTFPSYGEDSPITLYKTYLKLDSPIASCKVKHQSPFGAHLLQLLGSFERGVGREQQKEEERPHVLSASKVPETKAETSQSHPPGPHSAPQNMVPPGSDVKAAISSLLQNQMSGISGAPNPDSLLPFLRNLSVEKNLSLPEHRESREETCRPAGEETRGTALEKLVCVHMERMERTLLDHIDEKMQRLQEHLDARLDLVIGLIHGSSFSHPGNAREKCINGQTDLNGGDHNGGKDCDCNGLSRHHMSACS